MRWRIGAALVAVLMAAGIVGGVAPLKRSPRPCPIPEDS
jgi:hypothetical protein